MKFIVIKREVVVTTRVYEVEVDPDNPAYPNRYDRATDATNNSLPISEDVNRHVNFNAMEKL